MRLAQISQSINAEEGDIRRELERLVLPGPEGLDGWFKRLRRLAADWVNHLRHEEKPEAIRADDSVEVALSKIEARLAAHKAGWLPVRDGRPIIGTFGGADWAGTARERKVRDIFEAAKSM
jgi:hypothetical protein